MLVFVDRVGGLGNQLFQYAAACAVAHHHPNSEIVVSQEKNNPHNHHGHDYAKLLMRRARLLGDGEYMESNKCRPDTSFTPWCPEKVSVPVHMCGYFQYYPAVRLVLPSLLEEWRLALRVYCSLMVDEEKSMFMHVRRGDYLSSPDYFHIQTQQYYENAFSEWKKKFVGNEFHVFFITNDAEWCRQQDWSFTYTIHDEPDEVRVLAFMSQCKAGAVIANSTFSYWGAMLSGTKHVFYPEKWVAEEIYDLCPSSWLCVSG